MGNRRFAQAPTSDEEDNSPPPPRNSNGDEGEKKRKRIRAHIPDEEDEEKDMDEVKLSELKKGKKKSVELEPEAACENEEEAEEEEEEDRDAQPLGDVVRVSGKGRWRRKHFASFEYDGLQYDLEDPVLLVPEQKDQKPYVAIIKDISQTREGAMKVTGQWFYRPEEAKKKGGGNWVTTHTRELFYSFHRDEVPAESVMHKCVVHFVPVNKQFPHRKQHPGFIVQKVYDTVLKRLFKLTDKDYEDNNQHEIDILVQKTLSRIPDLPDLEPEDATMDHEDLLKNKRVVRKKNNPNLDVSKEDGLTRSQSFKAETPGPTSFLPEFNAILSKSKVLTGETQRDKWLEKLLESVKFICTTTVSSKRSTEEEQSGNKNGSPDQRNGSPDKDDASFEWPDAAVRAVVALEKAAHDTLSADFLKYNQKMRKLSFNLKSNAVLTRRLLNKELEPAQILNMSPNELKEGLTAEEIAIREPEESAHMQMTDARCERCMEKQVGLIDIIQAGHADRYQFECIACGNVWYASRDDISSLTIEGPTSVKTVGTAPLATAKFEDVEKTLLSPRGGGAENALKKTTEAFVPVLENQRSFTKTRAEESPTTSKTK